MSSTQWVACRRGRTSFSGGRLCRRLGATGGRVRAQSNIRQRLYKIERVDAGLAKMDGRLREATPRDRDLALQWCTAFAQEAVPHQPSDVEDAVDRHLKCGTLYFWGRRPSGHDVRKPRRRARINLVYTPPDLRRRGYATAAVAALSHVSCSRAQTVLPSLCGPRKSNLEQHLSAHRLSTRL